VTPAAIIKVKRLNITARDIEAAKARQEGSARPAGPVRDRAPARAAPGASRSVAAPAPAPAAAAAPAPAAAAASAAAPAAAAAPAPAAASPPTDRPVMLSEFNAFRSWAQQRIRTLEAQLMALSMPKSDF